MNQKFTFIKRYIKGFFNKKRFMPSYIPSLSIETTNICSSNCVFCANRIMKRKRTVLDMSLFKKAIDEYAFLGAKEVNFNAVVGEPLADPFLLERARYVKSLKQFKTLGFVTTLQGLEKFDIGEFLESGITWLGISIVLSGKDKYRDFFGIDRYENVLENLVTLINENNKNQNINYYIDVKPTKESKKEVIKHSDFKMINSLVKQDLVSTVRKQGIYVDDWLCSIDLPSYLKRRPLIPRWFRPCGLLYNSMVIYSNGNMGMCQCRDFEANSELILGNIKNSTLQELWLGEKITHIRNDWHKKNKIPGICRKCRHYLY